MAHSFIKLWVHAIWTTKDRIELIPAINEGKIFQFMRNELNKMNCEVNIINGMSNHIHCLFQLDHQKCIANVIKQIKGSSSHFINTNNLTTAKFSWQVGYSSFSVSQSMVERVEAYIRNQKQHHQKVSFEEEYNSFLKLNGYTSEHFI